MNRDCTVQIRGLESRREKEGKIEILAAEIVQEDQEALRRQRRLAELHQQRCEVAAVGKEKECM